MMWRKRFVSSYGLACLIALALIATCLIGQRALASSQNLTVRMSDNRGNGWSGGVIAATDSEYLIATCAHGADRGATVFAIHQGTEEPVRCREVWVNDPGYLDLSLYAVPKTVSLVPPQSIAKRPEVGDYLFGWGHAVASNGDFREHRRSKQFGGRVVSRGAWSRPNSGGGLGPYDDIDCKTRNGDSGSVLWDIEGNAAGVQWGSSSNTTVYTPLLYAKTAIKERTQVRLLQGPCQGCQPAFNPPMSTPRLQPPPEAPRPLPPKPEPPDVAQDPECCDEIAKGLADVKAQVDDVQQMVTDLQQQLQSDPGYATKSDLASSTPDLGSYVVKDDLAAMEGRLKSYIDQSVDARITAVNIRLDQMSQRNPIAHLVVIAEEGTSYWGRLAGHVQRAKDVFHNIQVAPPDPSRQLGQMPVLVEYSGDTPVQSWSGEREVAAVLGDVARGRWKDRQR